MIVDLSVQFYKAKSQTQLAQRNKHKHETHTTANTRIYVIRQSWTPTIQLMINQ